MAISFGPTSDCPSLYSELRVEVVRNGAGHLSRVSLFAGAGNVPAKGGTATDWAAFQVPVEPWEVEAVISRLVVKQSRNTTSETSDPAKDLGGRLLDAALGKEGKRIYAEAVAMRGPDLGLCVCIGSDDPDIGDLPWELMYDRDVLTHFVALAPATSVLRRGHAPAADARPAAEVRVVVVSTEPATEDATDELARLVGASGLPTQSLVVIKSDGWEDLKAKVVEHSPTLLHVLGSGQTARRGGQRLQIHRENEIQSITASQLSDMLRKLTDLQVVTFHGEATDRLAAAVSPVVPVSVGFRELVNLPLVLAFLREFYTGLWRGLSVPSAVTAGRSQVVIQSQGGADWAAPVVVSSTLGPLVVPGSADQHDQRRVDSKNGRSPARGAQRADSIDAAESASTIVLRRSLRIDEENREALEAAWSTVANELRPAFVVSQAVDLDARIKKARSDLRRLKSGSARSTARTSS